MAEGLSARMLMEHMDAQGVWSDYIEFGLNNGPGALKQFHSWEELGGARAGDPRQGGSEGLLDRETSSVGDFHGHNLRPFFFTAWEKKAREKAKSGWVGGQFVARLAEHFGLLTAEILRGLIVIAPELPIIDMAELVRLQICREIDDTWAWANPAPVQAPPPPPAPARTMPQIMDRLEEDVYEIRGTLVEQRKVISVMACDISRFYTWTTTSLARMIERSGVSYTSYSHTPREYQRHAKQRTGEASTSAAQQDQQQPDL
ncbi:hypothetical protein Tco_0539798 [Tanacetum coccineum]